MHPSHPDLYLSPLSALELFLMRMPDDVADSILLYFDAVVLLSLSRLNSRLRAWMDWYSSDAWNIEKFVGLYVRNNLTLLSLIDGKDTMLYGKSMLRFFLRNPSVTCPLDICTTLTKFYHLHRFLLDEGYDTTHKASNNAAVRRAWRQVSMHERVGNILHDAGAIQDSWSLTADQSWSSEDHIGYKFQLTKTAPGRPVLRINLHLIRCEPYRHVLATSLCEYGFFWRGFSTLASWKAARKEAALPLVNPAWSGDVVHRPFSRASSMA
ncbi:hypothetical protein D9611_014255 [Ephemerocybe angulata]|uniref:F-box domain-containing protein n=1 Tax=Ephemerocybe angulata TaxID=980116 RepID=A0A8H5BTF6_9AGAR|nr:hypothetical protein D9611_014255 [Tulosesus angulatus]